jgi:hypothetical protein
MANVKLIFGGSPDFECFERTIQCFVNTHGGLYICIRDNETDYYNEQYTVLDKQTAIKLSRELRKQISLMED